MLAEHEVMDAPAVRRAMALADEQAWGGRGRRAGPGHDPLGQPGGGPGGDAQHGGRGWAPSSRRQLEAARAALARTPEQLPALRRAGVVDAGGQGLVVLLEALADVVRRAAPGRGTASGVRHCPRSTWPPATTSVPRGPPTRSCTCSRPTDDAVGELRAELAPLGDSLVVVGGDGSGTSTYTSTTPGAAIEAGLEAGRPQRIRVVQFAEQIAPTRRPPADGVGLVAGAPGAGLTRLFEAAGAVVVATAPAAPVDGRGTRGDPRHRARAVVVLPNDRDTSASPSAAAPAARATECGWPWSDPLAGAGPGGRRRARPGRRFDDDVVAMAEAAAATRHGA